MHNLQFHRLKYPLLLLFVCFLAYLPVSSFSFALKNDAFIYNFPNKYFFSEALQNNILPTWNPYLNYGFPLYADPGFAWWQPITWLFGLIGYNAYTFSVEVLFYIYIAGLGMYWLMQSLGLSKISAFAVGMLFMCSGFFIGNLQHVNFLTCASFLPWLFGSWNLYQNNPNWKHLLFTCISAYLLFTGGHPAIPIATCFYFIFLTLLSLFSHNEKSIQAWTLKQLKLLFGIGIFLMPLFWSYWNILSNYTRSESVNQQENLLVGFTIPSFISFLFPFATIKNYDLFLTDVSMRNSYFSIPGLIFLILFFLQKGKTRFQKNILIAAIVMLVLSFGGKIKQYIYSFPLLSVIRTNGEFRVFVVFSFLLLCAPGLDCFFKGTFKSIKVLENWFKAFVILLFIALFILLLMNHNVYTFSAKGKTTTDAIKHFFDNVTFEQTLIISIIISILFATTYLLILRSKQKRTLFIVLLSSDIIINSWLLLPVTGVGKTSVLQIEEIISKSPKGFPAPYQNEKNNTIFLTPEEKVLISNWSWYDKKIQHPRIDYPSILRSTENFYNSTETAYIKEKPFLFFKNNKKGNLQISHFDPNKLVVYINNPEPDTLIILQNMFRGWQATINSKQVAIDKYAGTFIAIPVNSTSRLVELKFCPF